jgi:hypothetical protein
MPNTRLQEIIRKQSVNVDDVRFLLDNHTVNTEITRATVLYFCQILQNFVGDLNLFRQIVDVICFTMFRKPDAVVLFVPDVIPTMLTILDITFHFDAELNLENLESKIKESRPCILLRILFSCLIVAQGVFDVSTLLMEQLIAYTDTKRLESVLYLLALPLRYNSGGYRRRNSLTFGFTRRSTQ